MDWDEKIALLVPNLGALQHKMHVATFNRPVGNADPYRSIGFRTEQLPYCLGSCLSSLSESLEVQRQIVLAIDVDALGDEVEYDLPLGERNRLAYRVDWFLESAVRAQNALSPYLQFRLKRTLPPSFRDIMEELQRSRYSFSSEIDRELREYWDAGGQKLRTYRDLSQHHAVLSSDARVLISGGVIRSFIMPLPHNPEVKAPSSLLYDNDAPDAISYLSTSFFELVRLVRRVVRRILGSDERAPRAVIYSRFKEGMVGFPAPGVPIRDPGFLEEQINVFLSAEESADAEDAEP